MTFKTQYAGNIDATVNTFAVKAACQSLDRIG
jgi:hypothetical protein